MDIFKKSEFLKLADIHEPHCVSIYIPTERSGGEEARYKNNTRLKIQLKEASNQLQGFGLAKSEIETYLKPAYELVDSDNNFWSKQSDSLALFLYADKMEYYSLPTIVEEYTYISNQLYLQPLANLLHGSGRHFIMLLSLNDISFFEATEHTLTVVETEGLIPESMTEAVGTEVEESSLQFRSGHGEQGEALYHGHGVGSETEKKEEISKYFNAVNKGLMEMLRDENAPLVVACVDYLFPIYQKNNSYKGLQDQHISGNHEHTDVLKVKELAWDIVKDQFNAEYEQAGKRYNEYLDHGKAAYNPEDVIPAALNGQAESLFIKRGEHIWGTYQQDTNKIAIDAIHKVGNTDLLNKAAVETVKHGGSVYVVDEEDMLEKGSSVSAVFRYTMQ